MGYKIFNQNEPHFLTFTAVGWIDLFTRQIYRDIFLDSLRYCQDEKGLVINAYVIMSNHVHIVARTKPPFELSAVIRDLKSFTTKTFIKVIETPKESRQVWLLNTMSFYANNNKRNSNYQFWTHDNHPMEINTLPFATQKINYIHNNPVKAGLVKKSWHFQYSSASNYISKGGLIDIEIIEASSLGRI